MPTKITGVLDHRQTQKVLKTLGEATLVSGEATAGQYLHSIKSNLQLDSNDPAYRQLRKQVADAIWHHPLFNIAAWPKAMSPLTFSRYDEGMHYGTHIDNPLMGRELMRSDLSFTLFLSEPESYEGGELVIESGAGETTYKLNAGDMLLYPSTCFHRVNTVESGQRVVAIGWIQSLVRDEEKRQILLDLELARHTLLDAHGKTEEFDLLTKSCTNLLRLWAEV